ncbi:MAG: hypothetical protein IPK82_22370 [Polyangiaceae bacterium]|nr:hypothetical protein [Polyangiaceae bacterium]
MKATSVLIARFFDSPRVVSTLLDSSPGQTAYSNVGTPRDLSDQGSVRFTSTWTLVGPGGTASGIVRPETQSRTSGLAVSRSSLTDLATSLPCASKVS